MIIIGITGGIGHGKTTLAEAFSRIEPQSIHLESSDVIAEVVDAWHAQTTKLPNPHSIEEVNAWLDMLPSILGLTVHEQINPQMLHFAMDDITKQPALYDKLFTHLQLLQENPALLSQRINITNKGQYRAVLQWLGGYLVKKVDPGIWYKEIMRRAHEAESQGKLLCTIGGLRFPSDAEIVRGGGGFVLLIHRPLMTEQDISDPTERERAQIKANVTVTNDAGLTELVMCAQKMLTDIRLGRLQARYITSEIKTT